MELGGLGYLTLVGQPNELVGQPGLDNKSADLLAKWNLALKNLSTVVKGTSLASPLTD